MKTRLALLVAVATVAALAIVGAAQAHVTVHPNALPAGGFTVINIQVPNERGNASTVRIDVQFPNGIYIASPTVMPGWRSRVITKKLSKPVEIERGFSVSSRVDRVVFSGGRIVAEGGPEMAAKLEAEGYEAFAPATVGGDA